MSPRIAMVTANGKATFNSAQVARLQEAGDTRFHTATAALTPADLATLLEGAELAGVTPRAVPTLSSDVIGALPVSVRGVAVFATGVDFVDLRAMHRRRITLAHLPDYSGVSVAEHTIGLLLTLARRLHLSRDRGLGRVPESTSVRGWQVSGRSLGVIGLGRIGSRVAALGQALGMRVFGCDPRDHDMADVTRCSLDELLSRVDVVSLHAPTTFGAGPLLTEARIALLQPEAVVINTSRAQLVDETAIVTAVRQRRVAGYAVDDWLRDRAAAARLLAEGRLVETGHTAWYSQEALDRGLDTWVDNVVALARGRPRNVIGPVAAS
ncbi:MAG: 2-hydroxyacid dehydrogenase [Actinomycetota bacterium]|nr:2-hydroxyacid dehydrogenase [Actinomycetota bacterium]